MLPGRLLPATQSQSLPYPPAQRISSAPRRSRGQACIFHKCLQPSLAALLHAAVVDAVLHKASKSTQYDATYLLFGRSERKHRMTHPKVHLAQLICISESSSRGKERARMNKGCLLKSAEGGLTGLRVLQFLPTAKRAYIRIRTP